MAQTAMTPQPGGAGEGAPGGGGRGALSGLRRMFAPVAQARGLSKWMLWVGILITLAFVVLAVFAPLIAPYDFAQYQDASGQRFPKQGEPSDEHAWGTTVMSFDVLSRVIYGARTALQVMILAVIFSMLIGVPLGLLAGFFGRWLDRVLVMVMDALFAFPYLLLAIVAAFLLSDVTGGGVATAALAITVVYVPQYFRVVRGSTLSAREATYVEAARAMGAKPPTIIMRYIFANVIQSVPVIGTLNAADAIATLAGLGFLGFGIQPTDAAEWGYDLQRAIADASSGIWWTGLFPGLAIVLLVTGLTLVGEGLNDVYNPTLRRRRFRKIILPPRGLELPVQVGGENGTGRTGTAEREDTGRPADPTDGDPTGGTAGRSRDAGGTDPGGTDHGGEGSDR